MAKVYLIRGLPCTGKSEIARRMIAAGLADVYLERDMYFKSPEGQDTFRNCPQAMMPSIRWVFAEAAYHLSKGKNVIVVGVFSRRHQIHPYRKLAGRLKAEFTVLTTGNCTAHCHSSRIDQSRLIDLAERYESWEGETLVEPPSDYLISK